MNPTKIRNKAKFSFKSIFHQIKLSSIDWILLILLIIAAIFSLYILTSAAPNRLDNRIYQYIIGFSALVFFMFFPSRALSVLSIYGYLIIIVLLILTKFFGITVNGSQRWLNLGPFNLQVSEFAKLVIPLYVAHFISKSSFPLSNIKSLIVLLIIAIPALLILKQPDLGTAILVSTSGLIILYLAMKITPTRLVTIIIAAIAFAVVAWKYILKDYQKTRVLSLLNPQGDPLGANYHVIQSKIAIGSGGMYGKGLHNGTQVQFNFLPEKHTDFIFAVVGEELGFIGIITLFVVFLLILTRMAIITHQTRDFFSKLVATSFTFIFFAYLFVNIGMVSGILPVVGIPLPLISYGGSSYLMMMISFGIIMSIHRQYKNQLLK